MRIDVGCDIVRLVIAQGGIAKWHARLDEASCGEHSVHAGAVIETVRAPKRGEQIANQQQGRVAGMGNGNGEYYGSAIGADVRG